MRLRKINMALLLATLAFGVDAASFTTGGNALRKAVPGMIQKTPVLFCGELDGSVACYTLEGKQLWRNPTQSPAVLFEIAAVDVDGDGRDDLVSASGDGSVTCWKSDGSLAWKFTGAHKIRFNEVAVLKRGKDVTIYAGGNDKVVYALDGEGKLITTQEYPGVIRKLEVGDFKEDGAPLLLVITLSSDKYNWSSFGFYNPDTLKEIASLDYKAAPKKMKGMMTDVRVADVDKDGRDDVMYFVSAKLAMSIFNGEFKEIASFDAAKQTDPKVKRIVERYSHVNGISVAPARDEILMQFGQVHYLLDSKGNLKDWSGAASSRFSMADFCYHPAVDRLYGIGSISGGNGIYEFDMQGNDWWKTNTEWIGRLAEVTDNLETLYDQMLAFEPPAYQQPASTPWVMAYNGKISNEVMHRDFNKVIYVKHQMWSENYDRSDIINVVGEESGARRDPRKPYNLSQAEIVTKATAFEAANEAFVVWAGHAGDPFYMSIDTLEAILEAAPTTCHGFIYAEMANTEDPRNHYFINHYLPRLAAACRKQGVAKLHFRYKQLFWATTVHMDPWADMFLSGKYADVLSPATEDTNSITQELNLAGRVGMFAGGYVNDFGMRLIDDNPTGWRPLAPCRQKTLSPFLRSGVMRAAYGARYGVLHNFYGFTGPDMTLLLGLMGSGILPRVEAEDILSIGSWHLMEKIPHDVEERTHSLGHDISQYQEADYDRVFAATDVHWSGASVPAYDFSKALGVDYRWLNFMPELPYGMIPIAPASYRAELTKKGVLYSVSDSQSGRVDGQKIAAEKFGPILMKTAQSGASKMPLIVKGAAWSAIRLDKKHVRLILIDPGYLDPQERQAEIFFQQTKPKRATDILTKTAFKISGNSLSLSVPAGSMRFVDLAY